MSQFIRIAVISLVASAIAVSAGAAGLFASPEPDPMQGNGSAQAQSPEGATATPVVDRPPMNSEAASGLATLRAMQASFNHVAMAVLPVVVKIDTTTVVNTRRRFGFPFSNPGEPGQPREFEQPGGTGSGIVVERNRGTYYVLTNNHVIENTNSILLTLDDGVEFEGELVGRDPRQDLALLSFESTLDLPVATLGNSSGLRVGDWVLAIGSPFGFQSTVTTGIVSALGRETGGGLGANIAEYIQTDAAINPGNSGGALVNLDGHVVGINTWIASRSGGNAGVGFALPIDSAKRAINDFITTGAVRYGYLGAFVDTPSDEIRQSLGVEDVSGALAWSIILESPADRGDLRPGDYITRVGDLDIGDSSELVRAVGGLEPGRDTTFAVIRDGERLQVEVQIALRDDDDPRPSRNWPGIFPVHLSDDVRRQLGVPSALRGLLIGAVNESSAAGIAGLQRGDIVTGINGDAIRNARDFYQALAEDQAGAYSFDIVRRGEELTIRLRR